MGLQDDLKEKWAKEAEEKAAKLPAKPSDIDDTNEKIKAFKVKMELESLQAGYENFQERENSLESKESALIQGQQKLETDKKTFEEQQGKRVTDYNKKIDDYNESYALLKTKHKEVDSLMTKALEEKARAENIIKAQSEQQRKDSEKREAYETNMAESLKTLGQIGAVLRKQTDVQCFNLGKIIKTDLALISRMQDGKASLFSVADVVAAEVTRINEICEHLQGMRNTDKLVNYLMSNTDWIEQALKISWVPADKETITA